MILRLGTLQDAALSPNAQYIATCGDVGAILWNGQTGEQIRAFIGHDGTVTRVVFSPDGTKLLTASTDDTAKLWNVDTGEEIVTFTGHSDDILDIAFSSDGTKVVTGSSDNTAKIWNRETGEVTRTIDKHSDVVHSVGFSADGTLLMTGSSDSTVQLWDSLTVQAWPLKQISCANARAALSADGTKVLTAYSSPAVNTISNNPADTYMTLWDIQTEQPVKIRTFSHGSFEFHFVYDIALSPDGTKVLTAGGDDIARLWDAETGEELQRFISHEGSVNSVAFSADGTRLLTCSGDAAFKLWFQGTPEIRMLDGDNTVKVWDAEMRQVTQTFSRHSNSVTSVAFSPDGTRVLTGSSDGTTKLCDADSGEEIWSASAENSIRSVAFSPNGAKVLTGGSIDEDGNNIKLWDAQSGDLIKEYSAIDSCVANSVAFSADGTEFLAAGSAWGDVSAQLCRVDTGEVIATFPRNMYGYDSAAISPDGTKVLIGGRVGEHSRAMLWDVETGDLVTSVTHSCGTVYQYRYVYSVAFSPDGTKFLTGGDDNTAKLWDAETGDLILSVTPNSGPNVRSVAFSPDGTKFLTGSHFEVKDTWDKTIISEYHYNNAKLWNTETGELLETLSYHSDGITCVAFSPDGTKALTGSYDNTAIVWDLEETGKPIRTFLGHMDAVHFAAFSPDGTKLLVSSNGARLLQAKTGKLIRRFGSSSPNWVAFSPDGTKVLMEGTLTDGTAAVGLWDTETGERIQMFSGADYHDCAALSPDGDLLLSGGSLQNIPLEQSLAITAHGTHNINAVAFSPDGSMFVTASDDDTAKLWNTAAVEVIYTFSTHTRDVNAVRFSFDGSMVLTGSDDNTAKLWDTTTGEEIQTFTGHNRSVVSVAFSPDGTKVLTGSDDRTAKLWDATMGNVIKTLSGHTDVVNSVGFSPDSTSLLTCSDDGTIRIWPMSVTYTPTPTETPTSTSTPTNTMTPTEDTPTYTPIPPTRTPTQPIGTNLGIFQDHADIDYEGRLGAPGSATYDEITDTYTVQGSGDDIWNEGDSFHFLYKEWTGNFDFRADVTISGGLPQQEWIKAMLMARQDLTPGSVHIGTRSRRDGQFSTQWRTEQGGDPESTPQELRYTPLGDPYPMRQRLERIGNTFNTYYLDDSGSWVLVDSNELVLNDPIYLGFAVTAHDTGEIATGTFSNIVLLAQGEKEQTPAPSPADTPVPPTVTPTITPTDTPTESPTDTPTETPTEIPAPTLPRTEAPTPTHTLTPTFTPVPTATPTDTPIPLPPATGPVAVNDNVGDTVGDLTGLTDFDTTDNRNLTIRWTAPKGDATDWHVYVRKGLGGMKYLGHTLSGSATTLDWYLNAPGLGAEFKNGPDFNSAYTFRVVRIDGNLGPDDYFSQAGMVGFNIEDGNPVALSNPAVPNLEPGQICIYDDILGGNDLAPVGAIGSDNDDYDWRAIQIAWNFGMDPSTVNMYHVEVSENGGEFQYLGQTGSGNITYFWWTSTNEFKTAADFADGPQDGKNYQFRVILLPLEGTMQQVVSGTLMYSVSE